MFGAVVVLVACLAPMLVFAQDAGCRAPALDLANACLLASGAPMRGIIEQAGGSTAFRFEVGAAGGQASLVLDDLPADYDLYLTDDHGGILGQSVHDGTAAEELLIRLPAGTYYAVVQSDPSRVIDASRPYTLRLTVTTLPVAETTARARSILVSDDFEDPARARFPSGSNDPARYQYAYVDGEYLIRNTSPENGTYGIRIPDVGGDTVTAVDARLVGPTAGRFVSISCRDQQPANLNSTRPRYSFVVFPATREVTIIRADPGAFVSLVPRRVSTAILADNATNHLELSCIGDTIAGSVNGQQVGSVQDATYKGGQTWISIGGNSSDQPRAEVRLDNLVVYGP